MPCGSKSRKWRTRTHGSPRPVGSKFQVPSGDKATSREMPQIVSI